MKAIILTLLIWPALTFAELATDLPATIRDYLKDRELTAREYKDDGSGRYVASSPYKQLIGGHNIAYYLKGSAFEVEEVKLVLNVNSPTPNQDAHVALAEAAGALCKTALGKDIPEIVYSTILKGEPQSWPTTGYTVSITKDVWPTGRGYELHFVIARARTTQGQVRSNNQDWIKPRTALPGMVEAYREKIDDVKNRPTPQWWLNTLTGERHNEGCRFFKNTVQGRTCPRNAGDPCALCGG